MKLYTFLIVLMFVPEFVIAREMTTKENVASSPQEQATAPYSPTDQDQHVADVAFDSNSTFEVLSKTAGEDVEAAAHDEKTGEARVAKKDIAGERFLIKTGLRFRVESAKVGIVSETEATYRNVSGFYKVNFDSQNDASLGLMYVLSRDVRLQIERSFTGTMDPVTRDKPSLNLVQMVYNF